MDDALDTEDSSEKKEKTIYYVTDENQQSQYINMFKKAKMDAVMLKHNIDQPFITQLEAKNEGIRFKRIDADIEEALKTKTSKKVQEELEEKAGGLKELFKKALKVKEIDLSLEKLKDKKTASMITLSEESRRMQDMMKMYSMPGMDPNMFGGEGEKLILNVNHPLVEYLIENKDTEDASLFAEQLYDLAKIQQAPLKPEEMTKFIQRSNDILLKLSEK